MTTQEIAKRLVELCRKGNFESAQEELFSKDAKSIEPHATPAFQRETAGLDAIKKKGEMWESMVEKTHQMTVSEPLIAGDTFAVSMDMDVTMKERGRTKMKELCVYSVKDGKIVLEEFFS
ncbi:MAG TPA: nuclear transport factor 2 family protein [Puia sp.]|nr:nuclear transport factor 2 family protein [Puia sp.]